MIRNRISGPRWGARAAGIAAAVAVALGLSSTGAANADVFVPLAYGEKALGDGGKIVRSDESAKIVPSFNPASRQTWVSGRASVDVKQTPEGKVGPFNGPAGAEGTNNSSTHGASQINTGYIVGCQADIAGLSGGTSFGFNLFSGMPSGSVALTVPVLPGQVRAIPLDSKDILKAGRYEIQYTDRQITVQNCGGFAQARSYIAVEIIGDNYVKTVLYGQPFSIG